MKTPTEPTRKCGACDGTGRVTLPVSLLEILSLLSNREALTATQLRRLTKADVGVTAINNRLEELRSLGLLTRKRFAGRGWKYSRVLNGYCHETMRPRAECSHCNLERP